MLTNDLLLKLFTEGEKEKADTLKTLQLPHFECVWYKCGGGVFPPDVFITSTALRFN